MTTKSKSILDEAYEEAKALEEALKENAKDLLSAVMKKDLEELVKESLDNEDDEDQEEEEKVNINTDDEISDVDINDKEEDDDEEYDDEEEYDNEEEDDNDDNEEYDNGEEDNDEEYDEDDDNLNSKDLDNTNDQLVNINDDSDFDDDERDVIDMTSSSDNEVLKVFKRMNPEDGIIVTRDDEGNIDLNTGTEEFKIITNEPSIEEEDIDNIDLDDDSDTNLDNESDENDDFDEEDESDEDDVIYELDLDSLDENMPEDDDDLLKDDLKSEMHENKPRVMANRFRTTSNNENAGPYTDGKRQTRGALHQEELARYRKLVESLKAENRKFKKAVEDFKKKLHEVAVFNSNLAYAVRLFTEQTTTKKEKINILRRFDNVKTLEESRRLFETIQKELNSAVIKEAKNVDKKITKTPTSGALQINNDKPKTQIFESKIYEDPIFKRSLDIMKKINK